MHLFHCVFLVTHVTTRFSKNACFGREKGACDQTLKASADLFDFLIPCAHRPRFAWAPPEFWGRLGGEIISTSLAGRNLHLVIPWFSDFPKHWIQPLVLRYWVVNLKADFSAKGNPANAVCRDVLNLFSQVGLLPQNFRLGSGLSRHL